MIIYKVINMVNNKIYIGMTCKTLEKRKRNHLSDAFKRNSAHEFHKALRENGEDNFTWEVIDTAINKDELKEKEKFWIEKYNSFGVNGYNSTKGGIGVLGYKHTLESKKKISEKVIKSAISKGSNNYFAKLIEDDVLQIKELIKSGMSFVEIAKKFNVVKEAISLIKTGKNWGHIGEDLSHIEIKKPQAKLTEDEVRKIKMLLKEGKLSQTEIAKKFSVKQAAISEIKIGKSWKYVV